MFRPFFAFVGYRYTRIKRKNHFISFISLTSVIGVALGVSVLITVLSVMNGFDKEIRAQMLSGTPHVTVGKMQGALKNWQALKEKVIALPEVLGVAPYTFGQGMLSSENGGRQGALIKGIDPAEIRAVFSLDTHMKQGDLNSLTPGSYNMIVGKNLANHLGLSLGDKISLYVPEASVTPAGMSPRIKRFTITGIFEIGDLYDGSQAFINLKDADKLFRLEGGVSGIQIKLKNEMQAPEFARHLYYSLNDGNTLEYGVIDWTQELSSFFRALKIQKTVMMFILLLIIMVAAFNMVSTLVMMVTDKRPDIAIMRALGASRRSIMGIFVSQGSIIGLIGTIIGVILGLYMAYHVTGWTDWIQKTFNVDLLSKDVYLINFLPSDVHVSDIIYVIAVTLFMCLTATLYPAWRATKVQPAEALRYE